MSVYAVIDASVSLKWALDDEDAVAEAVALRDAALAGRFEMVAPSLWMYEVTNGVLVAARRGRLPSEEIGLQALDAIMNLGVRFADPAVADVYALALEHSIAAYDSAYLALAQALDAPLWTGDRPFYNAVRDKLSNVFWIGEFKQS